MNPNSDESHHANLRLALGSILSPKRPHSAQSSVSGTASPASFGPSAHRPSYSPSDHNSSSQPSSPHGSPLQHPMSNDHADAMVPEAQSLAPMNRRSSQAARPPLTVVFNDGDHVIDCQSSSSGERTPSGRFIATLQSKSAWDALIHGSMV